MIITAKEILHLHDGRFSCNVFYLNLGKQWAPFLLDVSANTGPYLVDYCQIRLLSLLNVMLITWFPNTPNTNTTNNHPHNFGNTWIKQWCSQEYLGDCQHELRCIIDLGGLEDLCEPNPHKLQCRAIYETMLYWFGGVGAADAFDVFISERLSRKSIVERGRYSINNLQDHAILHLNSLGSLGHLP